MLKIIWIQKCVLFLIQHSFVSHILEICCFIAESLLRGLPNSNSHYKKKQNSSHLHHSPLNYKLQLHMISLRLCYSSESDHLDLTRDFIYLLGSMQAPQGKILTSTRIVSLPWCWQWDHMAIQLKMEPDEDAICFSCTE